MQSLQRPIEIVIDTAVIILISFKDNESAMLFSAIYNCSVWCLKRVAMPKRSVLRNIIAFVAYDYSFTSVTAITI